MIIRQKYGLLAILLLITLGSGVWGQNNWEGTAVVGRYGEFPPGGLYVASNTFPVNSMVSVTNTQTGATARLIVAKQVDDPGVFMLLSEAAASELGVTASDTVGVRVEPVQLPGLTSVNPNQDLPYHPDPDVNPAASLGDPNASIISPDGLAAAAVPSPPATEPEPVPAEVATPTDTSQPDPEESVEPDVDVGVVAQIAPEEVPDEMDDPERDTPLAEVDETDFSGDGAVTGSAPTIAAQIVEESGEPEASMPRVNPVSQPPLAVALVAPAIREDVEDVRVADVPATEEITPIPVPEDSGDPLAERIAEVESELAQEQIAAAPLDISPIGTIASPTNGVPDGGELPEVDLTAAFVAESPLIGAEPPNPVRVVVELPVVEDSTTPQAMLAAPAPPVLEPGEIALPLVPVGDFLIEEDEGLRLAEVEESDVTEPVTGADEELDEEVSEPLRPTMIPEDAIVTLEPADYRSPEPPEPETDELEAERPEEVETEIALSEPEPRDSAVEEADVVTDEIATTPVVVAETASGDETEWAAANLPLIPRLSSGSAYVQVAAFSNANSAKQTVDAIGERFPVAVVSTPGGDRDVYRIYVGPLREDEKGSALYAMRRRGFRDAFVRDVE